MKVLFLDCDGVLNCSSRWKGPHAEHLDKDCLSFLYYIINQTGCKIVVSSTWRMLKESYAGLLPVLAEHGAEVVGKTPVLNKPRHMEIRVWVKEHKPKQFAIVDDDDDAGVGFEDRFFQTTFAEGLTGEIAEKIITCLNQE